MTHITTEYTHIQLNAQNVPIVAGTTLKVVEMVVAQQAYGWSPEEIHFQHPYLSMSQIHSALAYYWDHKLELDADIEARFQYAETLRRQQVGESPFVQRMKAEGRL